MQYGKWLTRSLGNVSRQSIERGSVGARQSLGRESHVSAARNPFRVIAPKRVGTMDLFRILWLSIS